MNFDNKFSNNSKTKDLYIQYFDYASTFLDFCMINDYTEQPIDNVVRSYNLERLIDLGPNILPFLRKDKKEYPILELAILAIRHPEEFNSIKEEGLDNVK